LTLRKGGRVGILLILVLALTLLLPGMGRCQEESGEDEKGSATKFGVEMDFNSRYVWRGIPSSRGGVLQPYLWVSRGNFTCSLWGNMPLEGTSDSGRLNEIDPTISYSARWGKLQIEPSLQFYLYPGIAPGTGELAVNLAYPAGDFKISTSHAIDIHRYRGAYFGEAGIAFEKDLSPNLSLKAYTGLGWGSSRFNEAYADLPVNALNLSSSRLSLTYYPDPKSSLYVRPHVEYTHTIDKRLRRHLESPDILNCGITVGTEF